MPGTLRPVIGIPSEQTECREYPAVGRQKHTSLIHRIYRCHLVVYKPIVMSYDRHRLLFWVLSSKSRKHAYRWGYQLTPPMISNDFLSCVWRKLRQLEWLGRLKGTAVKGSIESCSLLSNQIADGMKMVCKPLVGIMWIGYVVYQWVMQTANKLGLTFGWLAIYYIWVFTILLVNKWRLIVLSFWRLHG
jgi:hypothetical protein